jgi:Xaa-Pro aminopeptidase
VKSSLKWWKKKIIQHKVEKSDQFYRNYGRLRNKPIRFDSTCVQQYREERLSTDLYNLALLNMKLRNQFTLHEFFRNKSKGFAYTPIITSGNNADVLHYIENNQECKAGDLILLDVGAEYANYSS